MKFEFTGRHIEVTPALRDHVMDHFGRIDHLFKGKPANAHVIIEVERGRHVAEIVVKWRNDVLTANAAHADMYLSLSRAIDKIERQALKLKNKVIDKSHKAKKVGSLAAKGTEVKPAPGSPRIVKTRRYAVKPMTAEEAALELMGHENTFLVFRNADTERTSVIYEKKNGDYGLIEP
ncbi:MAG TPA: ribosome-associated translation inhibitor RaiA [Pyrinomonadaceae bacterium]|nr:ribosome-associated translation inhibitor RaiA [Pyrinomonadaceae bacterium]HMP66656.1 ribosome-associated translation inhibitor RaiA [Pyrinomonadaceae bacterium]